MSELGHIRTNQRGVVLASMVWIMLIMTASALAIATFAVNHFARTSEGVAVTNSLLVAEAGAEQTLYQLNQDNNFAGYSSEQEFFDNSVQGRSTYQTTVEAGSVSNEKIVTAIGRVYLPASDSTPRITRQVRLTVVGTTPSGYSVQTGPGGLIMNNSATIANGTVNINGYLDMSNSARIGSSTNPVNVNVAHVNCPTGGGITYPVLCLSGDAVTINNSAHIYGSVCATGQTNSNGMSNPGLQTGCVAPTVALPTHDRQAQVNAVTTTVTGSAASCSHSQTRTYAADTKIEGDVSISNSCQVTVNGNVWITGKFEIKNSGSIKVGGTVTAQPTIMVDGNIIDFNNSSAILANTNNIGFLFINYYSAASCSPNCSDVTGQDLFNSRNIETIKLNNSSLAAGSTMYARWTKVNLQNSGSIGAVVGQTVQLSNTGNISFGTNLSSGQSVWVIKNYRQVFD